VQAEGQADLLLDANVGREARLPQVQDAPEEGPRRDRRRVLRQGELVQGEREARLSARREAVPHARSNASSRAKGSHAWKEMMLFREEHPEEFERRYHKRSNAESTNASLKGKYGEFLHSRRWPMQKREAGLRVIAHNIRRLIRYRIRQKVELLD